MFSGSWSFLLNFCGPENEVNLSLNCEFATGF